ncbi:MAG TPA: twin-arginine translocase subunit TatC [Gemmatimonadota bacterium]|nr:twin-arginine translocase subunit TatC [Gemmatimonadota bacterium]
MALLPGPPMTAEATMSFLEHLEELRRRILWSLGALVLAAGLGFWIATAYDVIGFLTRPVLPYLGEHRLAYLHPTEPFMVTLKVGLFLGLLISLPVLFWHFWRFVAPGLLEKEKKVFLPALFASVALFLLGAAFAFYVAMPLALRFFLSFGGESLEPVITINEYFTFAIRMTLMFGAVFEMPLVILSLTWAGILSPALLSKYRRHAIVGLAVLSAVLTPADIFSMVVMLIPMYLLFELSVLGASLVARRRAPEPETRAEGPGLEPSDA